MNFINLQNSVYNLSKVVAIYRENDIIRVNTGDRITAHYYNSEAEAEWVFNNILTLLSFK